MAAIKKNLSLEIFQLALHYQVISGSCRFHPNFFMSSASWWHLWDLLLIHHYAPPSVYKVYKLLVDCCAGKKICVIFSVNSLKRFLLWQYECVDLHFQRHSPSFHQASWSIYNCSNSLRYEILIHMKISGSGTLQPQPGSIDWCCNWRLDMISFVAAFVSGFCRSELIAVSASQIAPVSQTMLAGLWFLFHWISTHWCPQVWISN